MILDNNKQLVKKPILIKKLFMKPSNLMSEINKDNIQRKLLVNMDSSRNYNGINKSIKNHILILIRVRI